MPTTSDQTDALLRPGSTCWRVARASRAALIVDAADYFLHLRMALTRAERAAYLIGWDFDLRIEMMPGRRDEDGNAPDGRPNRLGTSPPHWWTGGPSCGCTFSSGTARCSLTSPRRLGRR